MVPLASSLADNVIVAVVSAVVASLLAWAVGYVVSSLWDERRRRRESDLQAVATFYRLYGEFFATWKLWDSYKRYGNTVAAPDDVQWRLLERAEAVEGGFEALLVKLVSERRLGTEEITVLGRFREAYQSLRETIRVNRLLEWWATEREGRELGFQQYRAFKGLAESVAFLLEDSPHRRFTPGTPRPQKSKAIEALLAITARGDYYASWWTIPREVPPFSS